MSYEIDWFLTYLLVSYIISPMVTMYWLSRAGVIDADDYVFGMCVLLIIASPVTLIIQIFWLYYCFFLWAFPPFPRNKK